MAKGQKHGNREAKKPKQEKPPAPIVNPFAALSRAPTAATPKPGPGKGGRS